MSLLALTIDRSPEAVQACIDQGALGYLVKPLDAETFLRHVQVALERGRGSNATCAAPCETIPPSTRRWGY